MFLKKKRFLANTVILIAIMLYGVSKIYGSADAKDAGINFRSLQISPFVNNHCDGSIYSLNNLPQGLTLDPSDGTQDIIAYESDGHERIGPRFNDQDDFQTSRHKSPGSNLESMVEDQQLFFDETSFRLPASVDGSTDAEFGDVDGDGDLDLLVANTDAEQNRLFVNDGHGIFSDETAGRLPVDCDFSLAAEFGDVDGDGDLDIFVANNFAFQMPQCLLISGQNRLLVNDGEGVFRDETELRLPEFIAASTDAKCVDVDGDEDLDIIITNSIRPGDCLFLGGGQLQILINDGRGFFLDETNSRLPSEFHSDVSISMGDIDGDGDVDFVVANPYDQDRILVNNGSGVFSDQTIERLPSLLTSTRDIVLFDADSDEDLDIFCANDSSSVWSEHNGVQNRLFINNGSGKFIDETDTRLPEVQDVSLGGADVGDVDGDGDLDVIVANNMLMSQGRQNQLLINDGNGYYGDKIVRYLPAISDVSADIIFGDVNDDGIPDAFVANYGEQNILLMGKYEPKGGPVEPEIQMGDINMDGEVNVMDVLVISNVILNYVSLTGDSLYRADCNGDGYINILDALGIVNVILGLGECNPGGCKAQVTPEVVQFFQSLEPYISDTDIATLVSLIRTESFIPVEYGLSQNYPNPFNLETRIDYHIPAAGSVTLTIFNALGQPVRTLVKSEQKSGTYTHVWNGCDDGGNRVVSGIYFYRLKAGDVIQSKKMLLMK